MGKLKKRSRSSNHRANPVGSNKRVKEDKQNETLRASKVLPLITKLSSNTPNERSMALGSITVLVEDPKLRKLLLKEKLVQILLEKSLKDDNDEIVVEALGLLRNLVIEEGYDVAIYLWRNKIWTEIESHLEKAKISFDSLSGENSHASKIGAALLFDYLENCISLIVGLGDSSEDIFSQIYTKIDPIMALLKSILSYGVDTEKKNLKVSINLLNSILDLIYNFSSESLDFAQSLSSKWDFNFEVLAQFVNTVPRCNELSKVYLKGIELQLLDLNSTNDKDSLLLQTLQDIVTIIKDIDVNSNREIIVKEMDNANAESYNKENKKRIEARAKFQAIELSIELITAVTEYTAVEGHNEESNSSAFENLIDFLSGTISDLLISLLSYIEFRQSSLIALNNLTWLFAKFGINDDSITSKIWTPVIELKDVEIDEKINIFGVLWALLSTNESIPLESSFIDGVITDFQNTLQDVELELDLKDEYLVRLVGFLGTIAKRQGSIESNLRISKFFIELLDSLPNLSSVLVIEILDIFYEIFGDAEFDYDEPVFVGGKYLNKLEELKPAVKISVKLVDKNKNPALKEKGEEVFSNLGRFIEYKRTER